MKKKIYGALLLGSLLLAGGMVSCSDYDDDINSLNERVDALEKTVADLKAAIESGSVITNVQSNENGVTVTLSDGKTFELKNGTNGTPGSVVTIDEEGYWCIDGVRQTDGKGNPYKAQGEKGDTGADGQPGADGKDGCWYVPNEDGYWHKQYYNEEGTVVDEPTTNKWTPSLDSVVCVVYDKVNGYLQISNAEGMEDGEIISIPITSNLKSLAAIPYVWDKEMDLPVAGFYNIMSKAGEVATSTKAKAHFRLNPANADVKAWEWSMINRVVEVRAAGDQNDLLTIVSSERSDDDELIVTLKSNKSLSDLNPFVNERAIAALQGVNKETGEKITSDYIKIECEDLTDFSIVNPNVLPLKTVEYAVTVDGLKAENDIQMVYTESVDLNEWVATWAKELNTSILPIAILDDIVDEGELTYEFVAPDSYLGNDGITNQQDFVVVENGVVSVNNQKYPNGEAAIGRTPIVEVIAKVNGKVIASAYIRLSITREAQVPQEPFIVYVSSEPIEVEYSSIEAGEAVQGFTWDRMNREVYDVLKLSRDEFIDKYITKGQTTFEYKDVNNKNINGVTIKTDENLTGSTTTNIVELQLDETLIPSSVTGTATITYTPENTLTDRPIQIVFKFVVSHNHKTFPEFNEQFVDKDQALAIIKGQMINNVWTQKVEISEHFLNVDAYQPENNHKMPELVIDNEDDILYNNSFTLEGTDITDQVLTLNSEIYGNELNVPVSIVEELANGERICIKSYTIRFVNPLRLTPADIKLTAPFPGRLDEKNITFVVKDTEGRTIITNGTVATGNIYGIEQDDVTITYSEGEDWSVFGVNNDATQKLTLDGTTIKWENKGTALVQPVNTTYRVLVVVKGIAVMNEAGNVTVTETDM